MTNDITASKTFQKNESACSFAGWDQKKGGKKGVKISEELYCAVVTRVEGAEKENEMLGASAQPARAGQKRMARAALLLMLILIQRQ